MATKTYSDWPPQYAFPPFFTIQPNLETRKRQFEIWAKIILDYCKKLKIFVLDTTNNSVPLFFNAEISRQLSLADIKIILEDMQKKGQIEWIDLKKDRCYIYWHSPSEWAKIIYNFARGNGLLNSVETFFSLINSSEEFSDMESSMLIKCLKILESQGQAEIIGNDGVKFF